IDPAASPSKRRVYSSTAASPRWRTSARMSATRCSMAASVSADQCSRALKSASKLADAVDRRAGAAFRLMGLGFRDGRREGVDDAADGLALELERGLVDDQAGADVHDALHLDEVVGLERVAG